MSMSFLQSLRDLTSESQQTAREEARRVRRPLVTCPKGEIVGEAIQ